MFSNLHFLYVDIGTIQRNICSKIINLNGGKVLKRSIIPKRFKKSQPYSDLDSNLTHILIENKNLKKVDIFNLLYCTGISSRVKIIHWSWIEACSIHNTLCSTSGYEIGSLGTKPIGTSVTFLPAVTLTPAILTPVLPPAPAPIPVPIPTTTVSNLDPVAKGTKRKIGDISNTTAPTPIIVAPTTVPTTATTAPVATLPPPPPPPAASSSSGSSKVSKSGDIDCIDAAHTPYSGMIDPLGGGWFLLHNILDGDRTPSLLFKFSTTVRKCSTVIGFDMDSTLIVTKSGNFSTKILL